jgi:hypothetical protein
MTIFLDLAGSLIVRASMVTVMLGLTVTMNNALYESTQQANAAQTVATVGEIMYTDLNQAVASGFATWNSNMIEFNAYTDSTMTQVVTIKYDATQIDAETGLHKLYRTVGSNSVLISQSLVSANFVYYDTDGHVLPYNSGSVDAIRVKLVAQVSGVSQGLSTTLNDFKVFPPSLN